MSEDLVQDANTAYEKLALAALDHLVKERGTKDVFLTAKTLQQQINHYCAVSSLPIITWKHTKWATLTQFVTYLATKNYITMWGNSKIASVLSTEYKSSNPPSASSIPPAPNTVPAPKAAPSAAPSTATATITKGVNCPVCQKIFATEQEVNAHLDDCLTVTMLAEESTNNPPPPQPQPSQPPQPLLPPLPSVVPGGGVVGSVGASNAAGNPGATGLALNASPFTLVSCPWENCGMPVMASQFLSHIDTFHRWMEQRKQCPLCHGIFLNLRSHYSASHHQHLQQSSLLPILAPPAPAPSSVNASVDTQPISNPPTHHHQHNQHKRRPDNTNNDHKRSKVWTDDAECTTFDDALRQASFELLMNYQPSTQPMRPAMVPPSASASIPQNNFLSTVNSVLASAVAPVGAGAPLPQQAAPPQFVEQLLHKGMEGDCIICFESFAAGQTIARTECLCVFHKDCLTDWLKKRPCCPTHPKD